MKKIDKECLATIKIMEFLKNMILINFLKIMPIVVSKKVEVVAEVN